MDDQVEVDFVRLPPREMPPEIKEIFDQISQAITRMYATHAIFKDLYGTQDSVEVLNKTAPGAFFMIRMMFKENFIIAASRLTDPKETQWKDNLTFKQLIHVFEKHCDNKALVVKLVAHEKGLAKHCENIRIRRNKVVAHFDLSTMLQKNTMAVPAVEQKEIDDFLVMVSAFLNEVVDYYDRAHRDFNPLMTGNGQAIVQCLKMFHHSRHEEAKKRSGEI